MEEVWKDIEGYEGLYAISSFGNVRSYYTNKILKQETVRRGYKAIYLKKNGKRSHKYIHILVANAFIPNPYNLPIINHKDENPSNNNANNLEWCTYQYNNTYNDVHIQRAIKQGKQVFQYDKNGNLVRMYVSVREAGRYIHGSSSNISSCCKGDLHTCYGFVWSHYELTKEEVLHRFQLGQNTHLSRRNNRLSKEVLQFDLNGNFIASYPSTQEAGRVLGISASLIQGVCRGEHSHTHGFIFRYACDMENVV